LRGKFVNFPHYIVGAWKLEGEGLTHANYGKLEIQEGESVYGKDFANKVAEIVYGTENNEQ
jgi:hypothetical protein